MGDHNKSVMKKKKGKGSFRWSIFMHADGTDVLLMVLGFIGAIGDGMALPMRCFIISRLLNHIGQSIINLDSDHLRSNINKNAIILCYFAVASWFSCFLEGYCWTRTAERQATRMRARYLKAVLRQDVGYFDVHVTNISDVITSVSSESLTIQDCISDKVPHFIMNMSTFLGSYLAAFFLLWQLAAVGLPFLLFLVIPGLIYGRILMGIARKISNEYSKAGSIAEQAISSIRTVYAFVAETDTMAKFSAALEGSAKLGIKQGLAKGLAIGSNGITFAIFGFYSWYGSRLVMYQGVQGGNLFVVGAATTIGGLAFGIALSDLKYFSEATSAGERILEVIKRVPEIDSENMYGLTLENVKGEVEFKHVEFAYPARPGSTIFHDFSLHVPAGKTVALVGNSGSGKSTTVSLLQRFYDPLGGEILLDGVPIHKFQLKWLRSQIGLVSQEPALFATSIKDNILFGKEDATLEEVMEATAASNAHHFISQLPQGYETQVGERGAQLSGGQKQRIAIARAIIKRPQIVLLDEATSALDSKSERIVQEALDKVAVGRTTIIIAHRLSTIQNADTIAFVNDGQVIELGTHDELTQIEGGSYASLVRMQGVEKPQEFDKGNNVQSSLEASSIAIFDLNSRHSTSSRRLSTGTHSSSFSWASDSGTKPTNDDVTMQSIPNPSFWRLLLLNSPEWKQAGLGCLCALLFGAIQPVYSFVMGSMINVYFLQDHDEIKRKTRIYSWCFVGFFFFSLVVSTCQHYNLAYMGEYLTKRVREMMFSKILTFEIGWFDQEENSTGAICSRLAKDANMVRSLVGDRISLLIQACSAVIIATTMCLVISWRFALVMIVAQPLIVFCFYMKRVLMKNMSEKAIEAQETSSKLAAEAVYNIRTITSFSSQDRILTMLDKAQEGPRQEGIRQSWYAAICLGTAQSMTVFTLALCFGYGGWLLISGYIKPQALFEIFLIISSTGRVIADAGSMTSDLSKGIDAVGSLFGVLDRSSQIEPADLTGFEPDKILGHVKVCGVDFAYPTRPTVMVFKDFSIEIVAGRSTALVGQSGSGKSTIIGLVQRFYDPIKGTVKIDGRDIRSYCLRSLRKHLALVSQEPMLFAGTIRENIAYGASHTVDESEIIKAARVANADAFISSLKDGYDTRCGNKGVQLSGGQKQRIAIARAVLRNPAILLLDEATSALDGHSEKLVQDALESIMVGRTSIVVAHRLSTIQNCDEIAVLEKGKVVEKGTHSSLLDKGPTGSYYSLLSLQRKPSCNK